MSGVNTIFDVIAIGDTTQDIFLQMTDASLQCDIDGHNCRICFDYADKIAVDAKTDVPAVGNAANHAVGAARLGLKSAVYTVVGQDAEGQRAKEVLVAEAVDTRYLTMDQEHGTNLSVVINFKGERTIFVYHEPRRYKLPALEAPQWIYLTSASASGLETLHEQVLAYLDKNLFVKMAFNPGTHQIKLGLEKLKPLLQRAHVLFLNREESADVLGVKTRDIQELTSGFHKLGVKIMVLTDGPDGAYVSDGTAIWQQGIYAGLNVERTGAGDAYGSGFLAATIKGKPINEAMCWGNANATSVVRYIGAREGLLSEEGIGKMISENSNVPVKPYGEASN